VTVSLSPPETVAFTTTRSSARISCKRAEPDAVTATTPNSSTERIARRIRTATYATAGTVPTQRNAVSSNLYSEQRPHL